MESLAKKINEIESWASWLVLVGAAALVYHIFRDIGAELYHLLQ